VEQNRRQFLRNSAIVGGAVWVAPAIATVSSALSASPGPGCANCSGRGIGAWVKVNGATLLSLGVGVTQPDTCFLGPFSIPDVVGLSAVCGGFSVSPACRGDAHVAGAPVSILGGAITFDAVSTTAQQTGCLNTGNTTFLNLKIPPITSTPAANTNILTIPGILSVILNEQCCDAAGNFTVRGIDVTILSALNPSGFIQIVFAESRVGGCNCACVAPNNATCSPGP
jgi:hypothetical protein